MRRFAFAASLALLSFLVTAIPALADTSLTGP